MEMVSYSKVLVPLSHLRDGLCCMFNPAVWCHTVWCNINCHSSWYSNKSCLVASNGSLLDTANGWILLFHHCQRNVHNNGSREMVQAEDSHGQLVSHSLLDMERPYFATLLRIPSSNLLTYLQVDWNPSSNWVLWFLVSVHDGIERWLIE